MPVNEESKDTRVGVHTSSPLITESNYRSATADALRYLLMLLYNNISEVGVRTSIDFSQVTDDELINFGLITTGFLSLQTYESDMFEDSEYDKFIDGTFNLRDLTPEERQKLLTLYDTSLKPAKRDRLKANLCSIHDSTYSIVSKYKKDSLILTTPPPKLHTNSTTPVTTIDFFKLIRNLTAHSMFYKFGNDVIYLTDNGYVSIPKMWLRGYSELFIRNQKTFDTEKAREILLEELPKQNNTLSTEKEINQALSLIKDLFPPEIVKSYFRINNFIKTRLEYQPAFFKLTHLEDKIDIIINILDKNPNYIKQSNETINPRIIYNLQQLISKELEKRDIQNTLTTNNPLYSEMEKLESEMEACERAAKFVGSLGRPNKALIQSRIKHNQETAAKVQSLLARLQNQEKLSSANMDFYNPINITYLPVETSVNIIALLAYTDLVTSSLHEDTLAYTDYNNLSPKQQQFFSQFDMKNLSYIYKGKRYKIEDSTSVCFALHAIRNAICHGLISYRLTPLKQNTTATFSDTEITFFSDLEDIQVVGKASDFFKLFSQSAFTYQRPKEIITQKPQPHVIKLNNLPQVKKFVKSSKIKKKDEE